MSKLPSKEQILEWVRENPGETSKRDIARAFGIKGADRIPLKKLLRELEADGDISRSRKHIRPPGTLPPVTVLRVSGPDAMGDLWASPAQWEEDGPEPRVLMQMRAHEPALGEGDRVLARLSDQDLPEGADYIGRLIRRIGQGSRKILGIYRQGPVGAGGRIVPIERKSDTEWTVAAGDRHGALDGELVEAEQAGPKSRMGLPRGRITARLGDPGAPKSVSLIAIHAHGLPDAFPAQVEEAAQAATPAPAEGREDLRHLPLVTIDPADARDRDDAVCALPDPDVEGGYIVWVAIADVAHYVTPGSPLDIEARKRGNSAYFPDRVVPMLPEALSADLCSLHADVDRACLAVEIRLAPDGTKTGHRFVRGIMRSGASLTYQQAQRVMDASAQDDPEEGVAPVQAAALRMLWAAYKAAATARDRRQPLHLDLPERQIVLGDDGSVVSVAFKDRLEAHKLIEEFMVLANVCAAQTLIAKRQPLIFRVHEEPTAEKIDALRQVAATAGHTLAKGQVLGTKALNRLLDQAAGSDAAELINLTVLRSMQQAYYYPQNFGHFGLALQAYAHFTSPIRRYADLVVHRALISAHGWGRDGLRPEDVETLEPTAEWISQTERRAMLAERDTTDRYLAAYLAERVGSEFEGQIAGIARFGVFVKLDETGADGLVPMRALGDEYFHYDRDAQTLMGDRSGQIISLGQRALVRLTEAEAVTGGLVFELLELDGAAPARPARPAGTGIRRGPGKARAKKAAKARKLKRRR